jgi:hypothetical protein
MAVQFYTGMAVQFLTGREEEEKEKTQQNKTERKTDTT